MSGASSSAPVPAGSTRPQGGEDEEGGDLPSVGAIVDARPPAAPSRAAEEGEGDAPESSDDEDDEDDEDDGSSNRHGNDAALAFELPSDPPPSIRRQP